MPDNFEILAQTKCTKEILRHLSTKELADTKLVSKNWKKVIDEHIQQRINEDRVISIAPFFTRNQNHVIADVTQLTGGLTNKTFRVRTNSQLYVARQPGVDSSLFINRKAESYNVKIAGELGVAPPTYFTDSAGAMISRFIDHAETMSPSLLNNSYHLQSVTTTLKKMHSSDKRFANDCNVFDRNRVMLSILESNHTVLPENFKFILPMINRIETIIASRLIETAPCHNDTTPGNFILSDDKMWIIDWEYSANNDPVWDLVNLSMEAEFSDEQDVLMLQTYYGDELSSEVLERFKLYKPIVEYWVVLWSMVQISNKNYESLETLEELEQRRMHNCLQILQDKTFMRVVDEAEVRVGNAARFVI